jgi:hypothetical protein
MAYAAARSIMPALKRSWIQEPCWDIELIFWDRMATLNIALTCPDEAEAIKQAKQLWTVTTSSSGS